MHVSHGVAVRESVPHYDRLKQRHILRLDRPHHVRAYVSEDFEREPGPGQECPEVFGCDLHYEHVAHVNYLVAGRRAVAQSPVNESHDCHVFPDRLFQVVDELAYERRVLGRPHFHHVVGDVDCVRQAGTRSSRRNQTPADEADEEQAGDGDQRSDRREIEHLEGLAHRLFPESGDYYVGWSAYQGGESAQQRCEG